MPMGEGPIREGNRGGLGDFRWANVVNDKHRDNYLGNTVNAPQGRWQKNQDIHWYTRDAPDTDVERAAKAKRAELKALKDAEEEALSVALGFAPAKKAEGEGTGANGVEVKGGARSARDEEIERLEKEEKKRDKELRKELRALKRAEKELRREDRERERDSRRARRYDSEDRRDRDRERSWSRSPERERERERDSRDRQSRRRDEERYSGRNRDASRSRERERDRRRSPMRDWSRSRSREKTRRREEERGKRWKGSSTPPMRGTAAPAPLRRSASPDVKEEKTWIVDDDA